MSYVGEIERNFQIKVPKAVRDSISFKIGDIVKFDIKDGELIVSPLNLAAHKNF